MTIVTKSRETQFNPRLHRFGKGPRRNHLVGGDGTSSLALGATDQRLPRSLKALSLMISIVLCALCLLPLCSCASKPGDEGAVDHAIKYANARTLLDMATSSVVGTTPDARFESSLMSLEDAPDGTKEIVLEPAVISDRMASWSEDEWAQNRDDLFFNCAAHFRVICKQAHEFGDMPESYTVTCPDYMVVYDSQKKTGFIVASTGVYQKTDDPENPIGEAIVLTS